MSHLSHGHLCAIYHDAEERLGMLVAFVREGLAKGDACVCVEDDADAGAAEQALANAGVDVRRQADVGSLAILTADQYGLSGGFTAEAMIASLSEAVEQSLSLGYAGVRIAEDISWTIGASVHPEQLRRYEALANETPLVHQPTVRLCLYNRARLPATSVVFALKAHPQVLLGNRVHRNPYYEPPAYALEQALASERVDWMLAQLQRFRPVDEPTGGPLL